MPLLGGHEESGRSKRSSPILKRSEVVITGRRIVSIADNNDDISWELVRKGEDVQALRFRCACGRTTELHFEYERRPEH